MDRDKQSRVIRSGIGLVIPLAITGALTVLAPPGAYLWLKAIHIASAAAWIGGMLGVCYLLTWHAGVIEAGTAKLLSKAEEQLLYGIVNPAMVVAWGIGLWLAWDAGWFVGGWLQTKVVLALALSGVHGWVVRSVRAASAGTLERSATRFRNVNVAAAVIALIMIVLAVVKPM